MEKKDDLLDAGRSGGKEIEDLNVFFRPFLSSPSVIFFSVFFFFTFQGKKSCRRFKEATFSSL